MKFNRVYTTPGVDPFDSIKWKQFTALIKDSKGTTVFEQYGVEAPDGWSQTAVNIVASKYFRGKMGTPEREHSVKQLIGRVVNTVVKWAAKGNYFDVAQEALGKPAFTTNIEVFRDELKFLLVNQYASFNSPVWFNVGVKENPQGSACFLTEVEDSMESILDLIKTEGMIFKGGSGSGVNLSKIRGSMEPLRLGGTASGPVSFMKALDASAGVIKSGGGLRAARLSS